MGDQDKRGVPGHEPPPPRLLMAACAALGFDIAALIAILLDRCDLATILLIIAILFGGFVVIKLMTRSNDSSDKQGVPGHEPPPP